MNCQYQPGQGNNSAFLGFPDVSGYWPRYGPSPLSYVCPDRGSYRPDLAVHSPGAQRPGLVVDLPGGRPGLVDSSGARPGLVVDWSGGVGGDGAVRTPAIHYYAACKDTEIHFT